MKKRKLNLHARRAITLFSGLVIMMMGGFGYYAAQVTRSQTADYPIGMECVAYDTAANLIPMTAEGVVKNHWNGSWEVKLNDGANYDLGETGVVYDEGVLKVFGGGYRIRGNNDVERLPDYSEITDLNEDGFYKLADRRYLMTGAEITDDKHIVETQKYLYVVMDKSGNAVCMNDELCIRIFEAAELQAGGYSFDVSNEALEAEGTAIDCKQILGSTNEYDPNNDVTLLRAKAEERAAKGYTNNPEEIILDLSGGKGGEGGTGGTGGVGGEGGFGGSGGIGGSGAVLKKELEKKGIKLCRVFDLLMPDNSMLFYNIPPQEEANKRLPAAEEKLKEIKQAVLNKKCRDIRGSALAAPMRFAYHRMSSTKGFRATDKCIGCGLCERNCPEQAIKLENGSPVWVRPKCIRCSACINRCPVQAIEYGRGTVGRNRYVNPNV